MKTILIIAITLMALTPVNAQDIKYVNAENGLIVRNKPDKYADRVTKLEYGTRIEVTELTEECLDVVDNGKTISGEWVKIKTLDPNNYTKYGYVFSGFLTEKTLKKYFKVHFEEFTALFNNVEAYNIDEIKGEQSITIVNMAPGETIGGKLLKVKHNEEYRAIEVHQKFETSVTITSKDSNCDLVNLKHYYSPWEPLFENSKNNTYITKDYSKKAQEKVIASNLEDLKASAADHCDASIAEQIKAVRSIDEYPVEVSIRKVHFRIVMTDADGDRAEKIITFNIPEGY